MHKENSEDPMKGLTHFHALDSLCNTCMGCMACPLGKLSDRDNHTSGWRIPVGFPRYMIVGPQPTKHCFESDFPLDYKVEKKLFSKLSAVGQGKKFFYVTNLVKCIGGDINDALDICPSYLDLEVNMVKPKFIVSLGEIVFKYLTGEDLGDTGKFYDSKYGIKVYPVQYPSIRHIDDDYKRFNKDVKNLDALIDRLELPF